MLIELPAAALAAFAVGVLWLVVLFRASRKVSARRAELLRVWNETTQLLDTRARRLPGFIKAAQAFPALSDTADRLDAALTQRARADDRRELLAAEQEISRYILLIVERAHANGLANPSRHPSFAEQVSEWEETETFVGATRERYNEAAINVNALQSVFPAALFARLSSEKSVALFEGV